MSRDVNIMYEFIMNSDREPVILDYLIFIRV